MKSKYYKIRNKARGNISIKPVVLKCVNWAGFWLISKLSNSKSIGNIPSGHHCAVCMGL